MYYQTVGSTQKTCISAQTQSWVHIVLPSCYDYLIKYTTEKIELAVAVQTNYHSKGPMV